MKGAYTLLQEFLLFAVGLGIVLFVVAMFSNIENNITGYTVKQNMQKIADRATDSIVRVSENKAMNSTAYVEIPKLLSNQVYVMEFGRNITIYTSTIRYSQNIFNIADKYNISGKVTSSAGRLKIVSNRTHIIAERGIR